MLVLQRKEREVIVIEGYGTITVERINGDTVRLGLEIGKEFDIVRGELMPEWKRREERHDSH